MIKTERSKHYPAPGFRTELIWYQNEEEAHSHAATVSVYDPMNRLVLDEWFMNKSLARKFMFELNEKDIEQW